MTVDRGFDVERVLALNVSLLQTKYSAPADRAAFFQRLFGEGGDCAGSASGVAGFRASLSGETWINLTSRENETRPMAEWPASNIRFISPEILSDDPCESARRRTFEERDRKSKVAIISAKLAQRLWGSEKSYWPQAE